MENSKKILDVVGDVENKSNKDLFFAINELNDEFEKTKELIISLTRHMDNVEEMYNKVNNEIEKRLKK
jgi:galactitol-specific phosphotransferase system IIB component